MERLQRKQQRDAAISPVLKKEAAAADAAGAPGASADVAAAGGAGGEAAGAWEADDGLMSAMGIGSAEAPAPAEPAAPAAAGAPSAAAAGPSGGASEADSEKEETEETPEQRNKRKSKTAAVAPVQQQTTAGGMALGSEAIHQTAAAGVSGSGGSLPHGDAIQHSFGAHDVSGVSAHTGGAAASANASMGSEAYATGNSVAFGSSAPSLHTAAHEAAHVVQQRGGVSLKGGVGEVGDSHEQHADAVADRVVAGESASDLLDAVASPSGSGGGGGVQHKIVQFDVKSDLRSAMSGLGTDEDAIFARLQRASLPELQGVVMDNALIAELQDELSMTDMERVLDLISAPLAAKIRLAMSGWLSNDTDYIRRSLDRASPTELQTAGADTALVNEIVAKLASTFLKTVLDRMMVPLPRKLEYALSGWGADEAYISSAIAMAPVPEVVALAGNAVMLARLDAEGIAGLRGSIARRIFPGGSADDAFKLLVSNDDDVQASRLVEYGGIPQQRALLDGVIVAGLDAVRVQRAFHSYWNVEVASAPAQAATANGGSGGVATPAVAARNWPIATLQAIHTQMKLLPDQDTRAGVWSRLSLTSDPLLISRAAYGGGDFSVGSNASTTSAPVGGYGVRLTADAATGATTLQVSEGPRFAVGDTLAIDRAGPGRDVFAITAITANTYTIGTALTHDHTTGEAVTPDDGSALRKINWLDATVRHEIAHAVDGGSVNTTGFSSLGGWALGEGDAGFDTWAAAMGSPWLTNDGTTITEPDKAKIKAKIVEAVTGQKGSLFALLASDLTHPIMVNQAKAVPVIVAAETCLALGDRFYNSPGTLYAAAGKRFTVSWWYKRFQHHDEAVVSQRVANYGLYSPAEFFAEAYTVFYEEAGRTGVTDADYGRLIRNSTWRDWIRTNVHNRGLAPAGTGAATTPGGAPGEEAGAKPGGGSVGRASGNPGL